MVSSLLPPVSNVLAVSDNGYIVVRAYSPAEGESAAPISVTLDFRHPTDGAASYGLRSPQIKLRLVIGHTALPTTVRELPTPEYLAASPASGRWLVSAQAPPFHKVRFPSHTCVPLSVQAMSHNSDVLDLVTFGTFTYWESTVGQVRRAPPCSSNSPHPTKRHRRNDTHSTTELEDELNPLSTDAQQSEPMPECVLDSLIPFENQEFAQDSEDEQPRRRRIARNRRIHGPQILARTSAMQEHCELAQAASKPATLEWVVTKDMPHPDAIEKKWSANDVKAGRRLVRFLRSQEGSKLQVSCHPIPQESFREADIVISCIYRPETSNCWFTSVDVIYLLERLVVTPFTVEEKNRIRRNLEGFRPTTVSKKSRGSEHFFQQIMDFPVPKPRNIEKDVKVFPWSVLTQALEKIISKYSCFSFNNHGQFDSPNSSPQLSEDNPSSSSTTPSSNSPNHAHMSLPASRRQPPVFVAGPPPPPPPFGPHDVLPQDYIPQPTITFPEPSSDPLARYWRATQAVFTSRASGVDTFLTTGGELSLAEMEATFGDQMTVYNPNATMCTSLDGPTVERVHAESGNGSQDVFNGGELYDNLSFVADGGLESEGGTYSADGFASFDDIIDSHSSNSPSISSTCLSS